MNAMKPALRYCSGATHRYLGKQYRIKARNSKENSVKLLGAYFQVLCDDNDEVLIKALMEAWFRERAKRQFEIRLRCWDSWCKMRHLPKPKLHLRKMPKRWGSSHKDGKIFLNPDLIRVPSVCVDYVIAHEICHLKYHYHDREFYRFLGELFPNWKAVKLRLEQAEL